MDFSQVISKLRDYFVQVNEPVKAEMCNIMLTQLDKEKKYVYSLTESEAKDLLRYFETEAGWISYETSSSIHEFVNKLNDKVYGPKTFKALKENKEKNTSSINGN